MAIDPVMLALCRGKAGAGDGGLPYVLLTTPLSLSQEVPLTNEECWALAAAAKQLKPAVLAVHVDVAGDYLWLVAGQTAGNFYGSLILDTDVVSVAVTDSGEEIDPPAGETGTYTRYLATVQGATLTPIAPE